MFVNKNDGNLCFYFSIDITRTFSHGPKISRNVGINKCLFYFKVYTQVPDISHRNCFSVFNLIDTCEKFHLCSTYGFR